jgi:hypothetical protein
VFAGAFPGTPERLIFGQKESKLGSKTGWQRAKNAFLKL